MELSPTDRCLDLLRQLDPAPDVAQTTLSKLLTKQLPHVADAHERLRVLETARAPLARAQALLANRYANRPLPPASDENAVFLAVVQLWAHMADAYLELLSRNKTRQALADSLPLLWQRRVHYCALGLLEHYRAHRMVPADIWARLHDSYAAAEMQECAAQRVPEPLSTQWKAQSPLEGYIATLLVDLSNPFGRSPHEFSWICRWADRFAPYCDLTAAAPGPETADTFHYGLDLSADYGLRPVGLLHAGPASRIRHFDGTQLANQIRSILTQIKAGQSPAQLGLGADCTAGPAAQLLLSLYRPWGLAAAGRRFRRRRFDGQAQLLAQWSEIARHTRKKVVTGEPLSGGVEAWRICDQSVGGFRLAHEAPENRLTHRQLVGLQPSDGLKYLLGMVSWLMYRHDGVLEAGIALMAGTPRAASVHLGGERCETAFRLPAIAAIQQPASIVLPRGLARVYHIITVDSEAGTEKLRISGLLGRGSDFDHLAVEVAY